MKRILIFACLVSLAVGLNSDDLWRQYTSHMRGSAEKCAKEMGLPEDIVDRFITERHSEDIEVMGCLKACIVTDMNIMVDGKISLDAVYELIDDLSGHQPEVVKKLREIALTCLESVKHFTNECQLITELFNCGSAALDDIVKHI